MSQPAPVAIVIPSWNSAELLPACLDSVAAQEPAVELLVVDNGSRDGTLELLRRRGVEHVRLPENRGFAAAVNLGASRVAAPLVLPLNADAVLAPGAVAALAAAFTDSPRLGGAAPRILQLGDEGLVDPDAALLYSAGQALSADGRGLELGAGEAQSPALAAPRPVFGACGAACLLRRELFSELGGYDESYFSFYEDVDLNVRANIARWSFAYVPEAVVWHLGNASWQAQAPRPSGWNARLVARNRIVTQAKFLPAKALPRVFAVELGALIRAARQRRFLATLRGKTEGIARLPYGLRERRRLRLEGDPARARRWLGA